MSAERGTTLMSKTKKTRNTSNSRKIPRTQADVDKAYKRGMNDGLQGALTIMLYTLKDKFGSEDTDLKEFADAFNYTVDGINKGYVSEKDLMDVIRDEYGVTVVMK